MSCAGRGAVHVLHAGSTRPALLLPSLSQNDDDDENRGAALLVKLRVRRAIEPDVPAGIYWRVLTGVPGLTVARILAAQHDLLHSRILNS